MKSKIEYINLAIAVLIGYLFQCMAADKLLFLDSFIKDDIFPQIKLWSWLILIVFGALYLFFFILTRFRIMTKYERDQFNTLSRYLFNKIVDCCDDIDQSTFRVTIFKAYNAHRENPKLICIGRYHKRMPVTNTHVKFLPDEGCAGMCFTTQQIVSKQIDEYDPLNPNRWFEQCERDLKLPKKKSKRINIRSSTYLCLPLITYDTEQTWGVVVIDSIKKTTIFETKSRDLESIISNYSFIFTVGSSK